MILVHMGQLAISMKPEDVLASLGLGSCVAVCAYDPAKKLAGMIHVVLPSKNNDKPAAPAKFADVGVPVLVEEMLQQGVLRARLKIAILGGANVLTSLAGNTSLDIGTRNVAAVRAALQKLGLPIIAHDVGGTYSRTVRLKVASGEVTLKTLRDGEVIAAKLGDHHGHG